MFAKSQAKIPLRCYDQTLSNSSVILQPSQDSILFDVTSSIFMEFVVKSTYTSSFQIFYAGDLLSQNPQLELFSIKKQLVYLIVFNLNHITYLSTLIHVCCWQIAEEANYVLRRKLYYSSSPSHLRQENFVFSLLHVFCFIFFPFLFFGLLKRLTQI